MSLIVLGLGIIGTILYHYFGLFGTFTLTYDFKNASKFISSLAPLGRALNREQNVENGEYYQRAVAEPVYFDVQLPSAYPRVDVTLEYHNPYQPIVELGLQLNDDERNSQFVFQPIENKFVEQSNWNRLENKDYILLQREANYSSVEDFIANPPVDKHVGTWHAAVQHPFTYTNYQLGTDNIVIDQSLVGQHEFYTYIKDQPLEFTITTSAAEPQFIRIYRGAEQIFAEVTNQVQLNDLTEGVYRIVLEVDDATVISKIDTRLQKLVFKGRVHLTIPTPQTISMSPTIFYTPANSISATPQSAAGVGEMQFYDRIMKLGMVGNTYQWMNPIANHFDHVLLPQSDVVIAADQPISFSESAWFDPGFGFTPVTTNTNLDQLDYILSQQYVAPTEAKDWYSATARFDLTTVKRADPTKLHFMISAPGLQRQPQGLTVRTIKVVAYKDPVTIQNIWTRLKNKF